MTHLRNEQDFQRLREKEFAIHRKYRSLILNEANPDRRKGLYHRAYNELFQFLHEAMPEIATFGWGVHLVSFFESFFKKRRVLEIGCAWGTSTVQIARVAREAVGIDTSSTNINKARSQLPPDLLGKVRFECMDASELAFEPESFDVVYSNDMVEHLHPDDMHEHLLESYRILSTNGYYICVTPHKDTGPHDATKHVKPRGSSPEGLHLVEYDYGHIGRLLKAHGFDRITTSGISPGLLVRLKAGRMFRWLMRPIKMSEWLERSIFCRNRLIRSFLSLNLLHLVARKGESSGDRKRPV